MTQPPNVYNHPKPSYNPYAKITLPKHATTHLTTKRTIQTKIPPPPLNDNNTNYPSKKKEKNTIRIMFMNINTITFTPHDKIKEITSHMTEYGTDIMGLTETNRHWRNSDVYKRTKR